MLTKMMLAYVENLMKTNYQGEKDLVSIRDYLAIRECREEAKPNWIPGNDEIY